MKEDRYYLLTAVLISLIIVTYPIFDYDMFWHLANGREMVNTGHIISEDVFSFTHPMEKFSNHEWLSQTIFYLIWDAFGVYALFALKLIIAALVVTFLYLTIRMLRGSAAQATLLCIFAVLAGINRYHIRPELFSLLNTSLLCFLLYGFHTRHLPRALMWCLPPLFVVWDWLHGAVYGLAILGIFFVGENAKHYFAFLRNQAALSHDDLKFFNRCFAVTMLAMLLNPYGLSSYSIFIGYISGEANFNQVITEFMPLTWKEFEVFIIFLVWATFLALRHFRKIDVTQLMLLLVFGGFAIRFNRVSGITAIVIAPILASLIIISYQSTVKAWGYKIQRLTLAAAALFILDYGYMVKFAHTNEMSTHQLELKLYDLHFGAHVNDTFYPTGSVNFIKDIGLSGNLYNSGNLGGYLSYYITPERKIFQYNMARVFGDPFYYAMHPAELDQWNIDYAIIDDNDEWNALFPESEWAPIYRDLDAVLLLRRTKENLALINRYEVFFFNPTQSDATIRKRAADPVILPKFAEEMGVELAYHRDDRIASYWVQILHANPELNAQPAIQQLIQKAKIYNSALTQLVSQ